MLSKQEIKNKLKEGFSFDPTPDQEDFFGIFSDFLLCRQQPKAFVLKGFAGTGKTTLITAITSFVETHGYQTLLMAPTGRAAKVMSGYSGKSAYTIHRSIYARKVTGQGPLITLAHNPFQHAFFIVDEAGMIGSGPSVWTGSGKPRYLLDDLLEFTAMGTNCHLILCGDTAQLPPVGETFSAALNEEHLVKNYYLQLFGIELKNVVRQAEDSGILKNATKLRENLVTETLFEPVTGSTDFKLINGAEFTDELESAYSKHGHEGVCIVTRSNKRAYQYNMQVRNRLLYRENELEAGDLMMVVKNNYFWTEDIKEWPFIANGETVEIKKVNKIEQLYELTFADAEVAFSTGEGEKILNVKLLLDAISSDKAALPEEKYKKLFEDIKSDYKLDFTEHEARKKTLEDPYFNALQVKFAYAFTCHKTQGGQWPVVFIDAGYMNPETPVENLRWLYTAVTRATQQVFLVGWPTEESL